MQTSFNLSATYLRVMGQQPDQRGLSLPNSGNFLKSFQQFPHATVVKMQILSPSLLVSPSQMLLLYQINTII